MEQFLVLLTGMLTAVMISINGSLSASTGMYHSAVIIHLVGVVFSFILCMVKKEKIWRHRKVPVYAYLGGAVGVLTVMFNNYAFSYLSMTAIVALALFGPMCDFQYHRQFRLVWNEEKTNVKSFLDGTAAVLHRHCHHAERQYCFFASADNPFLMRRHYNRPVKNSQFTACWRSGAMTGSFINHLVGLPFCILLLIIMPQEIMDLSAFSPWMLLGGAFV